MAHSHAGHSHSHARTATPTATSHAPANVSGRTMGAAVILTLAFVAIEAGRGMVGAHSPWRCCRMRDTTSPIAAALGLQLGTPSGSPASRPTRA